MGCCRSKSHTRLEQVVGTDDCIVVRINRSDLNSVATQYVSRQKSFVEGSLSSTDFSLARAAMLIELSSLAYGAGSYWASSKHGEGSFRKGMAGLSFTCKYWTGGLLRDGLIDQPSRSGIMALPADKDIVWADEQGSIRDGLVTFRGSLVTGSVTSDTQAIISLRPQHFITDFSTLSRDLLTDALATRTAWRGLQKDAGLVHSGVCTAWRTVEKPIIETVKKVINLQGYERILVTGHSLGGGLATLCGLALKEQMENVDVQVYTFGGVAVGDPRFKRYFNSKIKACWRVIND
eukprot:CAMPEP_0180676180 /NCGR_PEP_ID=MMETSP1037_2-20121125/67174_1 /TAXON_ID=632150 /ORGANISM="Azadinium spinosum, Strain 3D9" /LENGTH=291 /DNA_ID=CAMNT_0022705665 /DNA_START=67 /DNA_END=940 /DNA_ORIENTATION=-